MIVECGHPTGIHAPTIPLIRGWVGLQPTTWTPMQHDTITFGDGLDARADVEHGGRPFVPQEMWKKLVRTFRALNLVDLGAADATVMNLDQHLPERQLAGQIEVRHDERFVELDENRGFHRCAPTRSR